MVLVAGLPFPAGAVFFNDVIPGARHAAMGATLASPDDPHAMFYNPSGLASGDFDQAGASIGRMFSPLGPLSFVSTMYSRPFPYRTGSNIGAGVFHLQQDFGKKDKTEFLLHYSESMRIPEFYEIQLTKPVKLGGNAKIISVDGSQGSKLGLGVDGGALVDAGYGLKVGAAVTNLSSELGVPNPTLGIGAAWTWRQALTFATDVKVRKGLAEVYPGMEAVFYQGLLKARLGKGFALEGVDQIALGFGVNFSPMIVDFAATVPWEGINEPGGHYQVSVHYRFGAPPFYGRFVGTAARQAEDLRSELSALDEKRRNLEAAAAAADANREAAEGRLKALENRLQNLGEELRALERAVDVKRYEAAQPQKPALPAVEPKKPRSAPFPRKHAVKPGDTLRSISLQHYGDPSYWELIYDANRGKINRGLPEETAVLDIPAPPQR